MKVQASGVGIRIASNIRYNIPERWIERFADKYQGLAIKGKAHASAEIDSRQDQGFDLACKLRSAIRSKHDPTHLIYKRPSQPQVSLADYVGSYNTKPRRAFR